MARDMDRSPDDDREIEFRDGRPVHVKSDDDEDDEGSSDEE